MRWMKVKMRLGLNMMRSQRSELEVHARANELDHEVRGPLERIGPTSGVDDGTSRAGLREAREQIFGPDRPAVGKGIFPTGPGHPAGQISRRSCGASAGRRRAVNVAFGVIDAGERRAAGDVSEVAIRCDSDTRTNGRKEIGRQRLRNCKRS